jgi:hypothetical protein
VLNALAGGDREFDLTRERGKSRSRAALGSDAVTGDVRAWSGVRDGLTNGPMPTELVAASAHTCGHFAALWRISRTGALSRNRTPVAPDQRERDRRRAASPGGCAFVTGCRTRSERVPWLPR